jgi:hypothetical protein
MLIIEPYGREPAEFELQLGTDQCQVAHFPVRDEVLDLVGAIYNAALSQTVPDRLMLQMMPLSAISCWNCRLVYWLP